MKKYIEIIFFLIFMSNSFYMNNIIFVGGFNYEVRFKYF